MIKRYTANKDTTITNAYKPNLTLRATGSNMGEGDVVEIFSIYGQASTGSSEKSRALLEFPVTTISTDRTNGDIPASGSVNFYLKLFNAKHSFTVPKKVTYNVLAVSRSWTEGHGVDMSEYTHSGICNWNQANSSSTGGITSWSTAGGDYHAAPAYTYYFENGTEDMHLDITSMVEEWIAGTKDNNGLGVHLTSSIETANSSSYTKKFFARGSEFFFKRPIIEARWNDAITDDRGNFWNSSSILSATDNTNNVYLYNYVRGRLQNIPAVGTGAIYVQVWDDPISGSNLTSSPVTGGYVETGVYSASFALNTTASMVYDRWHNALLAETYHTGTIKIKKSLSSNAYLLDKYVTKIMNLKSSYSDQETARMRTFTRKQDWCPNVYTVMNTDIETETVENAYYKIFRITDELDVIPYGTGSGNNEYTKMSYDISGSYFDIDMSLFQPNYMYGIKFAYKLDNKYREQKELFKFRVD